MTTGIALSIFALVFTIIGGVWKLSAELSRNTTELKNLSEQFRQSNADNDKDHMEMWDRIENNETDIADHETRLQLLEHNSK